MNIFERLDASVSLPSEEAMVVDSVRALSRDQIAPRAEHYDRSGEFPWDNVKAINALGLNGLFVPEAKETVEMMYEFEQPFIVDSSKFEKTFGTKATPIREAIKATVAWYKSHSKQN